MKKLYTLLSAVLLVLVATQTASAHALWIESATLAKKNKSHSVRIYYGDYPENIIEPTAKWYSDLKDLEVYLTSPSGKKTKLALTDATDHFSSSFTPAEDGLYHITSVHTTKELGGTTKYEFSATATVAAGKAIGAATQPSQSLSVLIAPKAYKRAEPVAIQILAAGQPLADSEVQIFSPEGWTKTLKTDEKGLIEFSPKARGRHIIEVTAFKPETGQWNGKPYSKTWKGSTAHLNVN